MPRSPFPHLHLHFRLLISFLIFFLLAPPSGSALNMTEMALSLNPFQGIVLQPHPRQHLNLLETDNGSVSSSASGGVGRKSSAEYDDFGRKIPTAAERWVGDAWPGFVAGSLAGGMLFLLFRLDKSPNLSYYFLIGFGALDFVRKNINWV